jgi:tRNA-splicing ligase RtcB
MQVIKEEGSLPIKAWVGQRETFYGYGRPGEEDRSTFVPDIEETALHQLKNLARMPFIYKHGVAVMPDVHAGIGATVGSVIATDKAIIPAAVGVDIGCGMIALCLSLTAADLPDNLTALRAEIERLIPVGMAAHKQEQISPGHPLVLRHAMLFLKHPKLMKRDVWQQLGSLGTGNHFIEVCLDQKERVWLVLHSGSRGVGNLIGRYFIEKAKRRMEQYFITLPDQNLAYFPEDTDDFRDYMEAVGWAQDYATANREHMMGNVLQAMANVLARPFTFVEEAINCHHNYVERENHFGRNLWVTRKGAIRARSTDLGIIPGSMGARTYIVRGKGNPESYQSCSHGAGRRMSRAEARRQHTVADLIEQTKGIECPKDEARLDEIPTAYKNIDEVMANQTDLVEVVHTLHQVLNVKG